MSNKFKVGDRVRLLKGVSKTDPDNSTTFARQMDVYVGAVTHIKSMYSNGNYTVYNNEYAWHEDWLEAAPNALSTMSDPSKKEFYKGDYIVVLREDLGDTFVHNHCYKQREDYIHIRPELDSIGSRTNGHSCVKFNYDSSWRYATIEEIAEYDRLGKPFDTTKYISSSPKKEETKTDNPVSGQVWVDDAHIKLAQQIDKDFQELFRVGGPSKLDLSSLNLPATYMPSITEYPKTPQQCFTGSTMMSMGGSSMMFTAPPKEKILQAPALIIDNNNEETFNLI